jgi:hypothetical protein
MVSWCTGPVAHSMLKDALPREWRLPSQVTSLYGNLGQSASLALITLHDTLVKYNEVQ